MLKTDTTLPKVVSLVAGGFSGSWSEFWFFKSRDLFKETFGIPFKMRCRTPTCWTPIQEFIDISGKWKMSCASI